MDYSLSIKHSPKRPHHAEFLTTANIFYFASNGFLEVRESPSGNLLAQLAFLEGVLDFHAYLDSSNQLCCVFLGKDIRVYLGGNEQLFRLEKEYEHFFIDRTTDVIYFASKRETFSFDLSTNEFATTSLSHKHNYGQFIVQGGFHCVFLEKSFKIINFESQFEYQTFELGEKMVCWDFKPVSQSSKNAVLAIGCEGGNVFLFKFKPTGHFESKRQKKWHAKGVLSLRLSRERDVLCSGGYEGVLVFWDFANDKLDFLPRLGSPVLHIAYSFQEEFFLVSTLNNKVLVKQAFNFQSVFERASVPYDYFATDSSLQSQNFLCVVDAFNHLFISRYNKQKDNYEIKEVNPTGRNFIDTDLTSSQNEGRNYKLDKVCLTPDDNVLVTAENFSIRGKNLFSKLKFFILKQETGAFELMGKFENPHINESIDSLHYFFHSETEG
jgi:hypothetical protein